MVPKIPALIISTRYVYGLRLNIVARGCGAPTAG